MLSWTVSIRSRPSGSLQRNEAGHAPARATVGVAALPLGARVEIDAVAVIAAG